MTWSMDDVTDADVARCERDHSEPNLRCPYCPARTDMRICARCDEEIWPDDGACTNCTEQPALIMDGFSRAIVVTLPSDSGDSSGVRAA